MISFNLSQNNISKKSVFFTAFIFALLLTANVFPLQAHAQTAGQVSILPANLNAAHGWTCTTPDALTNFSCTNSNASLKGDTLKCIDGNVLGDTPDPNANGEVCQLSDSTGKILASSDDNDGIFQYGGTSTSATPAVVAESTVTNTQLEMP